MSEEVKKVEWKGDEKFELHVYNENEIEVYRYVYPLKGYGNYFAFGIYYNKLEGIITLTHFSDGWNGSGIHFRKSKEVQGLDINEIMKMSPKKAFNYLSSFFDDEF